MKRDLIGSELTLLQQGLRKAHGTPAEFARAVYKCVPGDISMEEARQAVHKYNQEWAAAGGSVLKDMPKAKAKPVLTANVYRSKDGFRWHIKRKGRIVAESGEAYIRPSGARRAIMALLEFVNKSDWSVISRD